MRRFPLLVANWKMYPTVSEGIVIANAIKKALEQIHHVEVVLCPPAVMVPMVHETITAAKLTHLHLGAQNIHYHDTGAFTGEISASMVARLVDYVIVGHSERVKWFHETPYETNQKIQAALRHRLTPIVCVGELKKQANAGQEVVEKLPQLLKGVERDDIAKLVVAYEPVWAISSGDPYAHGAATGEYVQQAAEQIRKLVEPQTRVLYGGSTTASNIAEFLDQPNIDGALVGSASVKAAEFITMCEIASEMR